MKKTTKSSSSSSSDANDLDQESEGSRQSTNKTTKKKLPSPSSSSSSSSSPLLLDILRILLSLALLLPLTSHLLTSGSSLTFHTHKHVIPWLNAYIQATPLLQSVAGAVPEGLLAKAGLSAGRRFTAGELGGYTGATAGEEGGGRILLGLDGLVYDVSAGRRIYGPGGMYAFFSGRDASRAFVTGCFPSSSSSSASLAAAEEAQLSPSLAGVERIFVPVPELPDGPAREEEWERARREVRGVVEGWKRVFEGRTGRGYFRVGRIVGLETEGEGEGLCEAAERARPKRRREEEEEEKG